MNATENVEVAATPLMVLFAEEIQQPTNSITSHPTYAGVTGSGNNTKDDYTDDK